MAGSLHGATDGRADKIRYAQSSACFARRPPRSGGVTRGITATTKAATPLVNPAEPMSATTFRNHWRTSVVSQMPQTKL